MQHDAGTAVDGGRGRWLVPAVATLIILVPLTRFAYIGFYSRYMADDYCFAAGLSRLGLIGSQADFYLHWSGRFGAFLFVNLLSLPGPWIARVVPGLRIVGLAASLAYLSAGVVRRCAPAAKGWVGVSLGVLTTYLLLEGVPNLYQSLFWLDGAVFHTLPLIGIAALLGAAVRSLQHRDPERPRWRAVTWLCVGAFVIGGFSEVLTCGLVFVFALAFSADHLMGVQIGLRSYRRHLAALLAGTALALLVVSFAPGNRIRREEYPSPPDPLILATTSAKDAGHFLKSVVRSDALTLLTVAVVAGSIGLYMGPVQRIALSAKRLLGVLCAMVVGGVVLLVVLMLPVEYATRSYPSDRALTTAHFVLAVGVVSGACLMGIGLAGWVAPGGRRREAWDVLAACAVSACALALVAASITSTQIMEKDAQEFAAAWDQRDARIRAAVAEGSRSIHVPSLSSMGTLEEIKHDPSDWVNVCVAQYYGLDEVYAK